MADPFAKPDSAEDSTNTQFDFAKKAVDYTKQSGMTNQSTPFGTLQYKKVGKGKYGPQRYKAVTKFSPGMEGLFNSQIASQTGAQNAGQQILGSRDWSQGPDLGPTADETGITSQIMKWGNEYLDPIFNQDESQLESQLMNQGLSMGTEAWNNAKNLQSRNQNDAYTKLLLEGQGTALSAADQNMRRGQAQYAMPIDAWSSFNSGGQTPAMSFVQTPTGGQTQTPDYGSFQQSETQGNNSFLSGLFGIGSSMLGGMFG